MSYNGPHIKQLPRRQRQGLKEMMEIDERINLETNASESSSSTSSQTSSNDENELPMNEEFEAMGDMLDAMYENNSAARHNEQDEEALLSKEEKKLREESKTTLYPGAKTSRLATSLLLLNLQAKYRWSDQSLTSLFEYFFSSTCHIYFETNFTI